MLASSGPRAKEARAHELRLEFEDVLKRLPRLDDETRLNVSLRLAGFAKQTRETFGAFETISAEGKTEIARQLSARARETFEHDAAQGYAYFLLSALYEAAGLSGADADFVKEMCAGHVLTAIEAERSLVRDS